MNKIYFLSFILLSSFLGNAMAEEIFIYSHNEISNRFAILEDNEKVAFLYMTQQNSQKPEKDALAYMRITPPKTVNWAEMAKKGETPILSQENASKSAVLNNPKPSDFSFTWSKDGNSVSLSYKGNQIAFVTTNEKYGFSKAVSKENKLTNPWNQAIYEKVFNK